VKEIYEGIRGDNEMTDLGSPSQIDSIPEDGYKSLVLDLRKGNKITDYQSKGMLLEIATYLALRSLEIYPIPLHNPFSEDYTKDQHLGIDLIFRYENKTYGVECKNTSSKWSWSPNWIEKEVISRFENIEKVVSIDCKVLVTSYSPDSRENLEDYSILPLEGEVTLDSLPDAVLTITNLFSGLFRRTKLSNTVDPVHGYPNLERMKLRYIQKKLLDVYRDSKNME